jgi:hypothetical protein
MEPEERKLAALLLKESTDSEQEAFEVGQAMTTRWCPDYVKNFDYWHRAEATKAPATRGE